MAAQKVFKAIYRALPGSGHTPGALFMLKSDDFRVTDLKTGLEPDHYELVTRGFYSSVLKVKSPLSSHMGHLFDGDDGHAYVVFADWSALKLED